jgi:hypothetical protein
LHCCFHFFTCLIQINIRARVWIEEREERDRRKGERRDRRKKREKREKGSERNDNERTRE